MTSRTPPTCDMSLGSLTVGMREAGDFAESVEPSQYRHMLYLIHYNGSHTHSSAAEEGTCLLMTPAAVDTYFFKEKGLALYLQRSQQYTGCIVQYTDR